jgi:hypothetical protein
MKLNTNKEKLVKILIQGEIIPPIVWTLYEVSHKGEALILPPTCGGIVFNVKVGDSAYDWISDHTEPGVTVGLHKDAKTEEWWAFLIPVCIGNKAIITTGEAKGKEGIVTGFHTGILIDFPDDTLEKLTIGDKIKIICYGTGLELSNLKEDIKVSNIDPELLEKFCYEEENKLKVNIKKEIPGEFMGSGLGAMSTNIDYDIMTSDEKMLEKYDLKDLKLGDIVLIRDHFCGYGPCLRKGAVTIGVVIHGDSKLSGHGPGVLPILTTERSEKIIPVKDEKANIGFYLKCGRYR